MSYPDLNCPLRTDDSFRKKTDKKHHKDSTPLLELHMDMVEDVIIADSLHLFDLGNITQNKFRKSTIKSLSIIYFQV